MEELVATPTGDEFLVRVVQPGDYNDLFVTFSDSELAHVRLLDRVVLHGKWRVTVSDWPSRCVTTQESFDTEEEAIRGADEVIEQLRRGDALIQRPLG